MTGIITDNVGRPSGLIKAASGGGGGTWTLIKTLTASSDSTLSFVNGASDVVLDSTYPIYRFSFINIHPNHSTYTDFLYNMSVDTGSNYNVTKTTTYWGIQNYENDSSAYYEHNASLSLDESTAFQQLTDNTGNDNDQALSGVLTMYAPSSTTFAKHFVTRVSNCEDTSTIDTYVQGYGNTTSAVDAVQFKFTSDSIQSGKIKLYGLKDSA